MKVSYNWLQNYFEEKLPEPEKVSEGVIFHSFEVEEMEKVGNDTIFDIKILPDRAHDCLSHFGIAKEISAIFRMKLKEKEYKTFEPEQTNLKIEIKSDKCLRYMGRIVRNIKVDKSPDWLKERLETIGQKSINNIVDAANFVMFDLGQPIHCFDLDKLFPRTVLENSKKDSPLILIRQAREGEKMTTLDNREVKLNPLNMVIADEKNVLALAGIKGGKIAEVTEDTKNIIIEVANFNPTNVRKTSKEVNIFTDAVKRFENDLSPEIVNDAMNDMSALVLEMCKGATLEEVVDVYKKKQEKRKLSFNIKKISKRLGLDVSIATVEDMLKRFGVLYKNTGDDFEIVVPDMRLDLKTEEDMSEEIIRILGYEKLKEKLPEINWNPKMNETYAKISWARNKLLNDGYSEVMTYSFCNKGEIEVLASASDKKFLRTNLTDGLKESLKLNQLNAPLLEMNEIKIFEIGTIFKRGGEEMHIAYGDKKNVTEVSLEEFTSPPRPSGTPPQQGGEEISPHLDKEGAGGGNFKFKMWSMFPFIARDIAVWVPEGIKNEDVEKVIKNNMGELVIRGPELFDQFKKDGKTSYAFRLVFQSYDRTLTDAEINEIMTKITNKIKEKNGWQVR